MFRNSLIKIGYSSCRSTVWRDDHGRTNFFCFYDFGIIGGVTSMESYLVKYLFGGVDSMESYLVKFFHCVKQMKDESWRESLYCKFDIKHLDLFTYSMFTLSGIASLLAFTTTRMSGPKHKMLLGVVYLLVGAFLNGFAIYIEMLIIGRLLLIGCLCWLPQLQQCRDPSTKCY